MDFDESYFLEKQLSNVLFYNYSPAFTKNLKEYYWTIFIFINKAPSVARENKSPYERGHNTIYTYYVPTLGWFFIGIYIYLPTFCAFHFGAWRGTTAVLRPLCTLIRQINTLNLILFYCGTIS